MSIRIRKWTNRYGKIKQAIVVNWTDAKTKKRRLKTFEHMRHAKQFHAIVNGHRPTLAETLHSIRINFARGKRRIMLTRDQAHSIVKAFPK
jgi:hypothetical protein